MEVHVFGLLSRRESVPVDTFAVSDAYIQYSSAVVGGTSGV